MKSRFGTILFFVGFFLLFLFVAGDLADVDSLSAGYLLFGILFTVSGWLLLKSGRKPPEESSRFRTARKVFRRGKRRQDVGEEFEGED